MTQVDGHAHRSAPDETRIAAVRLVVGVTVDGVSLADQIDRGALSDLGSSQRARAQRLALTTLRQIDAADTVLKPLLRSAPAPMVRAVLRVATVEMLSECAPAHGVVKDAVASVRALGRTGEGFTGLVNAVLRNVARTLPDHFRSLPAQALPGWLRGRLMSAWGKKATIAIEAAHARGATVDLTPRDGDTVKLACQVGGLPLPTGSVRLPPRSRVSGLPGYKEGQWWVQDAASAMAARALAARPGERVLDLCAATGGKTLQLAASGADVTAVDISERRMQTVSENLARCGLTARLVVADAVEWQPDSGLFDAVLLDAPCSATGTLRRHPDLPFVRDGKGLKELFTLQTRMIDRAVGMLKPGGRLIYSTCSLLPDEGELQIAAALERHPGNLVTDCPALHLDGIDSAWVGPVGLRLRPDYWSQLGGMDGFFIAALRLTGPGQLARA